MKYKRKTYEVEAEQFLIEKSHPLLGSDKVINKPDIVKEHKGCGYRMCHICGGGSPSEIIYYVEIDGTIRYMTNGDYIVKYGNEIKIYPEKGFKNKFEKI